MNWSSVSNADHYDVRIREQNTGSWTLIPNIPSTTRTKTGLSSGTVYGGRLDQRVVQIVHLYLRGHLQRYLQH